MVAPHAIDTKNPTAVAEALKVVFGVVGERSFQLIDRTSSDVAKMFEEGWTGHQPINMQYHDLDHTFQVTVCMAHLLEGRKERGVEPVLGIVDWELAILAALLHDTGFLKEDDDLVGTGAKYTFVHEKRSCIFARKYLGGLGFDEAKIEEICLAVMCTGPRNRISNIEFQREEARVMAQLLVTADYLAQMSAADYLEKLPRLYLEFVEAFEYEGVPLQKRPYQSLDQLLGMTSVFWNEFVLPLLEGDAGGAYHYLSPEGLPNRYLVAVEENIAELERRLLAKHG